MSNNKPPSNESEWEFKSEGDYFARKHAEWWCKAWNEAVKKIEEDVAAYKKKLEEENKHD